MSENISAVGRKILIVFSALVLGLAIMACLLLASIMIPLPRAWSPANDVFEAFQAMDIIGPYKIVEIEIEAWAALSDPSGYWRLELEDRSTALAGLQEHFHTNIDLRDEVSRGEIDGEIVSEISESRISFWGLNNQIGDYRCNACELEIIILDNTAHVIVIFF